MKRILEAAERAEFLRTSETDAAKQFVEALVDQTLAQEAATKPRQRKRRKADMERFERAVAALSADLIFSRTNEASEGFMYRPNDRSALSETLVSSRHFEQLIALWEHMGLIEVTGYFQTKLDFNGPTQIVLLGRARRIRATQKLLCLASKHDIYPTNINDSFTKQTHLILPVTVRAEYSRRNGRKPDAKNIKIKGAEFDAQVALIKELNRVYPKHSFSLTDTPQLYRLFNRGNFPNFDFNMGGRLYCASNDNWQSTDPELRRLIEIDGESTIELDVRASHLAILYGLNRKFLDTRTDPYHIEGIEREVVKMVFTAWCGLGKPPVRWPKEQAEKYAQRHSRKLNETYKLKAVVEALRNRHPVIDKVKPVALDWSKLQFVESECFLSAMLVLSRDFEVPALPVHDSLIVRARDTELVKDMLGRSYEKRLGFRPVIRET